MNSIQRYSRFSEDCSKRITHLYSTSFSIGIRLFAKKFRQPIYALYGFVRTADEIVDSFHSFDKKSLLKEFTEDTFGAIKDRISVNPVLQSFQQMVNEFHIPTDLIQAFLESMKMDVDKTSYVKEEYDAYIYGSAEVIGLMCLYIFIHGDNKEYQRLSPYARSLGSAFQKVNFLRDIKSDFEERGRIYFPGMDITKFDNPVKQQIELEIKAEFEDAYIGIKQLPGSVKLGVFVAYIYYRYLFNIIKSSESSQLLTRRFRVPGVKKILILIHCWISFKLRWI